MSPQKDETPTPGVEAPQEMQAQTSGAADEIPIIDMANPDRSLLVSQMYDACSTWGFFQLVNHGISPELISSFKGAMGDFFALPYDTKVKLKRNANNGEDYCDQVPQYYTKLTRNLARGYFDDELTKRKRDWKEALDVGVPGSRDWRRADSDEGNACLDGYNQMPSADECKGFRDVVEDYFEACAELSNELATLMVLALGESGGEKFLQRMKEEHTSYLRMNYYPPSDAGGAANLHNNSFSTRAASANTLGISPHRDAGFLTILLQDDDCHSLQVARFEDDDHLGDGDCWVTVHPIPGSLTINTGDMAMLCSNGRFRAPLHRVLTDPAKKRYSAPFFFNPPYKELITPFDCCFGEESGSKSINAKCTAECTDIQPLKYHPCLWGYFRALRFAGDLTDLGVEIQTSHFKVGSESDHIEKQKRFMSVIDFEEPFDVEKYRRILE
ncbi:hypothetical protein ACHAXT_009803 [Thalassiosira profunda]